VDKVVDLGKKDKGGRWVRARWIDLGRSVVRRFEIG